VRILVAETDLVCLHEMQQALEQAGHDVTVANDGMTAWAHLTGPSPPDLLITRFRLGAGTPPGTALGLRAHFCKPRIPVIYIPASAERSRHADPEHGAVLVKPFAVTALVETVNLLRERVGN
jgi:DNA-binding response OmpR family regulator